jgi:hypothetical protein
MLKGLKSAKFEGFMWRKPYATKNPRMESLAATRTLFRRADWRTPTKLSTVKKKQSKAAVQLGGKAGNKACK